MATVVLASGSVQSDLECLSQRAVGAKPRLCRHRAQNPPCSALNPPASREGEATSKLQGHQLPLTPAQSSAQGLGKMRNRGKAGREWGSMASGRGNSMVLRSERMKVHFTDMRKSLLFPSPSASNPSLKPDDSNLET